MSSQSPPIFLAAEWRYLVMRNYEVDPALLLSHVPAGTELDYNQGKAFVSVVGFLFLNTKVRGIPIPFHRNFEEINLRFYVKRIVDGETRRGVVFLKEIVPRAAIAWTARTLYNEKYVAMPTSHTLELPGEGKQGLVRYSWKMGNTWNRVGAVIEGEPFIADEDSHEAFITEHYWGYAAQKNGGTVEYGVEHPRWNLWNATEGIFECDVESVYGSEFAEPLNREPYSVFVADGSEIIVRKGVLLR